MGGDPLGVFEEAAVGEIGGDAGGSHRVTTDRSGKVRLACPAFHHREDFAAMDAACRELSLPIERAKERRLRLVADARSGYIVVEILFERVVCRDRVTLAPFLAEVDPHAAAALFVVFHVHRRDRSDAGKRVEHRRDQRPVALAGDRGNINRIEKLSGLFGGEDRRPPDRHDMLRPAHRGGRVDRHHLASDEPVEQHLQCGEFLLDARSVNLRPEFFHIRSDEEWTDVPQSDVPLLAPTAEVAHRPPVGFAGVADRDREVFDQPPTRMFPLITKQLRKSVQSGERNLTRRKNEDVVIHMSKQEESNTLAVSRMNQLRLF